MSKTVEVNLILDTTVTVLVRLVASPRRWIKIILATSRFQALKVVPG